MNITDNQVVPVVAKYYSESQKKAIKRYYEKNKERIVQRQVERARERYQNDPEFREKNVIRMREASRKKKANKKARRGPRSNPKHKSKCHDEEIATRDH